MVNSPTNETDGSSGNPPNGSEVIVPSEIKYSKVVWSSLLSLLVLFVIGYYTFDLEQFKELIRHLNPWILSAAITTIVFRVVFGGWRLSYISYGKLNFAAGIRGQLAWDFFSNVTPSAIGGGPFAAVYVAREYRIAIGEMTAIMLFSMLLDQLLFATMIPVILIAMPFVEVFPASLGSVGTLAFTGLFLGMLTWVTILGYAILFRPELIQKMALILFRIKWLRRFRSRVDQEMVQLSKRSRMLRHQPARFYAVGFSMTMFIWLNRFLLPLLIIRSVFPDVDKTLVFFRIIAMSLGTIILPTPGGSGGIEGLYVLFLGQPTLPGALVAPTLLTWRILGYYIFIALGVYLSMHHVQKAIRRKRADAKVLNGNGAIRTDSTMRVYEDHE